MEYTDGYLSNLAVSSPVALVKDYERCADLDPYVYLNFADQLCDKWKLDEAVGMLRIR